MKRSLSMDVERPPGYNVKPKKKNKPRCRIVFFLMQEGEWNKNTFSYLHKEILEV